MSNIEAPDGWHWGLGESGNGYYDGWLYTDAVLYREEDSLGSKFGCEIHIWQDLEDPYHVELLPVTRLKRDGDCEYGYEEYVGGYETKEEALEAAVEKAREIR